MKYDGIESLNRGEIVCACVRASENEERWVRWDGVIGGKGGR